MFVVAAPRACTNLASPLRRVYSIDGTFRCQLKTFFFGQAVYLFVFKCIVLSVLVAFAHSRRLNLDFLTD